MPGRLVGVSGLALHEVAATDRSHEVTDFNALFSIEPVEPEVAAPIDASLPPLIIDESTVDETFEATAVMSLDDSSFASEPPEDEVAPLPSDFLLDFDDAPAPEAASVAATTEHDAPLQRESLALTEEEADALADSVIGVFDEKPAPEETTGGTVIPFKMPQPPSRNDDVRRIGSLTLSVALFNIYLTEADELLRVLTQDFAEWRHELDRYVSEGAMRAAHSLAGSSSTVGLVPAHDLAAGIEDVLQALWREPVVLRVDQGEGV